MMELLVLGVGFAVYLVNVSNISIELHDLSQGHALYRVGMMWL